MIWFIRFLIILFYAMALSADAILIWVVVNNPHDVFMIGVALVGSICISGIAIAVTSQAKRDWNKKL